MRVKDLRRDLEEVAYGDYFCDATARKNVAATKVMHSFSCDTPRDSRFALYVSRSGALPAAAWSRSNYGFSSAARHAAT